MRRKSSSTETAIDQNGIFHGPKDGSNSLSGNPCSCVVTMKVCVWLSYKCACVRVCVRACVRVCVCVCVCVCVALSPRF